MLDPSITDITNNAIKRYYICIIYSDQIKFLHELQVYELERTDIKEKK